MILKPMNWSDFFAFRMMITPLIIRILFWIGVVLVVLAGIITIVTGASSKFGGGQQVITGLVMLFFGPIAVRVYCELLILFFRMNETLMEISNRLPGTPTPPSNP